MSETTTIAALATAPAPAGIAVVRVSGPRTKQALRAIFRAKQDPVADPRRLTFGQLIDYQTGNVIDHALAVYMPGPNSYTGEDVGEFQFHGSPALVQKVLRSLLAFGAMAAEPGEFTRRAFLNGKIDLVQAEAIGELIQATSEQALRVASEHLHGRFSSAVEEVGEPLRDGLAEIEARLDFPEEQIPPEIGEKLLASVAQAHVRVQALLRTYSYGQVLREGFRVLLCGRPNVGKSSILNRLLGRKRAIVSEHSGTTRDLIEEDASIGGHRFVFCDSAGLRDAADEVEKLGVELAKERIGWADLVVFVVDAADAGREWEQVLAYLRGRAKKIWMVVNKIDLNPGAVGTVFCDSYTCAQNFYLSAKSGDGFDALLQALSDEVAGSAALTGESSNIVTNERHKNCLARAADALARAERGLREEAPLEIVSADLRDALGALDEIVGKTYTEDILSRIFSKFCIGK